MEVGQWGMTGKGYRMGLLEGWLTFCFMTHMIFTRVLLPFNLHALWGALLYLCLILQ